MKALVKKEAKEGIWLEDVKKPKPANGEVLIKVSKTAICGTDLHIYKWDEWSQKAIQTPVVIGHEFCGVIEEIGPEVETKIRDIKVGDRVTCEGHVICGECRNCRRGKQHICSNTVGIGIQRDGAFAEYVAVPAHNIIKLEDDISDDFAAIFDPFGNATHATLSFPILGEDVLITGAGLIGNMATAIAKFAGAKSVIVADLNEYRLEIARKMGADYAFNPTKEDLGEIRKKFDVPGGFDVGLEMSGSPQAFNLMLENMYHGGSISLLGILPNSTEIDWNNVIFKGLNLKGIYGREMYETWYQMKQMIRSGVDLSPVITHKFKIDDFQKGFDTMLEANCGKVILEWG